MLIFPSNSSPAVQPSCALQPFLLFSIIKNVLLCCAHPRHALSLETPCSILASSPCLSPGRIVFRAKGPFTWCWATRRVISTPWCPPWSSPTFWQRSAFRCAAPGSDLGPSPGPLPQFAYASPGSLLPPRHALLSEFHVAELKLGAGRQFASVCRIQTWEGVQGGYRDFCPPPPSRGTLGILGVFKTIYLAATSWM